MAFSAKVLREARARQGRLLEIAGHQYRIEGDQKCAAFPSGGEGLVHRIVDVKNSLNVLRVKVFWIPSDERRRRSDLLINQCLPSNKEQRGDPLMAAPFGVIPLEGESKFGVIMREAPGQDWKRLKERAQGSQEFFRREWPAPDTRLTLAYGLAAAIERLEKVRLVHADLSPGNIVVVTGGPDAGALSLVDFDSFTVADGNARNASEHRGTPGYAAPEVGLGKSPELGTDRFGLAVLIQELLISGDTEVDGSLRWGCFYEQDVLLAFGATPHRLFTRRYPELSTLLERSLQASTPMERSSPAEWRSRLKHIWTLEKRKSGTRDCGRLKRLAGALGLWQSHPTTTIFI